jgi:ABC-type dipeptide/oligopeptide/nickel transport system ATPase component
MTQLGAGCRFAPRCVLAEDACWSWQTELLDVSGATGQHIGRCRRMDQTEPGSPLGEVQS